MNLGTNESGFSEELAILMYFNLLVHRLSRHAIRYKGDLRTSSTAVLDRPMSASSRSSSSRSCLYWYRRSHPRAIPASHASGIFQDHLRSGKEGKAASRVLVELQVVLPQGMFHLRNGAKQRLAAGAHRAVVNSPSDICIIPAFCAQAIVIEYQLTKSPRGREWIDSTGDKRFIRRMGTLRSPHEASSPSIASRFLLRGRNHVIPHFHIPG